MWTEPLEISCLHSLSKKEFMFCQPTSVNLNTKAEVQTVRYILVTGN